MDEDVAGQQLISQGVNDRNIEAYLGVVEQRIDDLIQVLHSALKFWLFYLTNVQYAQISKAAQREAFTGMDFHAPIQEKKPVVLHVPHLPTLHSTENNDETEDNDDENAARVQPINIALLKDFMHKKVQKGMQDKKMTNFAHNIA